MENVNEKIIVALDFSNPDQVEDLINKLGNKLKFVKVGMELFYSNGSQIIDYLKSKDLKIFLDLKLHDIPTTVQKSIKQLDLLNVDIINIHAGGGIEMMKAAQSSISNAKLIAVTQLTSTSVEIMNQELLIPGKIEDVVVQYAKNAKLAGLAGVVASPQEVKMIKEACGENFITVTPGVRPSWDQSNDHKRLCTPKQAFENGTDYIVIGRTITDAKNPLESFERIIKEIEE